MDDFQKPDKLEKLEKSLYSTNSDIKMKPRGRLEPKQTNLPEEWGKEMNDFQENPVKKENKKGMSVFTKIMIVAFIFFLGALGYALYVFNSKDDSNAQNVDMTVNSQVSVGAGEQFTFDVIIQNNNPVDMQTVDLLFEYPEGTRSGEDVSVNLPRERYEIGSIESGSYLREVKSVYLFGEEAETKEIKVQIVYRVDGSTAVFRKEKVFDVVLKSTPVRMNLSSVGEITAGQPLEFDLEIISNSNQPIDNFLVKAEYPFGFVFQSSNLPANESGTVWYFEKIEPKEVIRLKVNGFIQGQNNEDKYFKFTSGLQDTELEDQIGVMFTGVGKNVVLDKPFLEIDVAINNDNASVINLKSDYLYKMRVSYKNNTKDVIKDAEILLRLDGEVLDEQTLQVSEGFYQSVDNTIIWNSSNNKNLTQLDIGEAGEFEFSFKSKKLIGTESFRNPEISLSAVVRGNRFTETDVPEKIENEVFKKLRFNTEVLAITNSLYYDGPFTNTGPIPPRVDEKTFYTIYFNLSNSSNRLSNAVIEMKLPIYVSYEDQTWPSNADILYDSVNRKVIWRIGEIREGAGFDDSAIEAAFQVSLLPSISQRGNQPYIVNDINFTANDLFTGEQIRISGGRISTVIADAKNNTDGQVTQ